MINELERQEHVDELNAEIAGLSTSKLRQLHAERSHQARQAPPHSRDLIALEARTILSRILEIQPKASAQHYVDTVRGSGDAATAAGLQNTVDRRAAQAALTTAKANLETNPSPANSTLLGRAQTAFDEVVSRVPAHFIARQKQKDLRAEGEEKLAHATTLANGRTIDEKQRAVTLKAEGMALVEQSTRVPQGYQAQVAVERGEL